MSMIEAALIQFSESEAAIATVQEYGELTVAVDGIGKVSEARKQVKRLRIDVEKRRKELNEGALKYQRAINEEAKRLTSLISPIEVKLQAEEDNYEEVKRREREAKEADKRAELNRRLNLLGLAGVVVTDIGAVESMDDVSFQFHLQSESRKAEESKRAADEARRQAAEMIEKQRREAAELAVKVAEEKAAMEAERAELRRQQEEIRQAKEAERMKEEQRLAAIAAEQERAAEKAREEAAKPDLEKLEAVLSSMSYSGGKAIETAGNPWWSTELNGRFDTFSRSIASYVRHGKR